MKLSLKQALAVGALALASTAAFADASVSGVSDVGSNSVTTPDSTLGYGGLTLGLFSSNPDATLSMSAYLGLTLNQVIPTEMDQQGLTLTWDISDMLAQANYSSYSSLVWGVNAGDSQNRTLVTTVNTSTGVVESNNSKTRNAISLLNQVNVANNSLGSSVDSTTTAFSPNDILSIEGTNYGAATAFSWTADTNSTLAMYQYVASTGNTGNAVKTAYAGLWSINLAAGTLTYAVAGGAPVPVPAALWLLFSGLAGLGVVGRRKA